MASRVQVGRAVIWQESVDVARIVVFSDDGSSKRAHALRRTRVRDVGAGTIIEVGCKDGSCVAVRVDGTVDQDELLAMMSEAYEEAGLTNTARMIRELAAKMRTSERGDAKLLTSEISRLMEAVDRRRGDIVPCLLGAPGIGKTEGIEEFARTHGRDVVHIIASQVLPTEVSGMTMPNQETHSMDVFDHARLSRMRDGDVLFLDELLKGQQQVLSACLTLVQERRLMSGTHLPDVIIVAAANPLASAKMLPEEIRQRFLFVDVEFDASSWCDYMRKRGVQQPEELVRYLVTKGGGTEWNTLTPRTMTKLALWYGDVRGNSIAELMIEKIVCYEFSEEVMNAIKRSLGVEEKKKARPMDEVRSFIRQSMSVLPEPADHDEEESRVDVLKELNKDDLDVASLLEKIQMMSGGDEIMRALGRETIDLSIMGRGEE